MADYFPRKLQVFVSSTYHDLEEVRQAAVEAILRAKHIPAGMELFAAGNKTQLDVIRQWIRDSDVFMLILGGRYGSIEPDSKKSYVQAEYDYAQELGKPFFACVMSDKWVDARVKEVGKSALEQENPALLKELRAQVLTKMSAFCDDCKDIKYSINNSLMEFATDSSLVGWVRGDQVADPLVTKELARLSSENSLLQERQQQLLSQMEDLKVQAASSSRTFGVISPDAEDLLISAEASDGEIRIMKSSAGDMMMTSAKQFDFHDKRGVPDARNAARWRAALDELVACGYVKLIYGNGITTFEVTHEGYLKFDEMKLLKAFEEEEE